MESLDLSKLDDEMLDKLKNSADGDYFKFIDTVLCGADSLDHSVKSLEQLNTFIDGEMAKNRCLSAAIDFRRIVEKDIQDKLNAIKGKVGSGFRIELAPEKDESTNG